MAPGAQPPQGDNSLGPLWIIIGLFVFCVAIWYVAHDYIVWAIFKLKSFELALIGLFTDKLNNVQTLIDTIPPSQVELSQLNYICAQVGHYIRIPAVILLCGFAVLIYRAGSASGFTQAYSMETLLNLESKNWPQIRPIMGQNLIDTHIHKGAWAMALTPMDFAKKYKLIVEEEAPLEEGEFRREAKIIAKLDRGRAAAVLTLQLGPLWGGVQKLSPQAKALFAIFAARANGDRKGAEQLLTQLSTSYDPKHNKTNYEGSDALVLKHINSKVVRRVTSMHAYVLTVIPTLLQVARYDGVLATADFLWLKTIDRKLWFMLNTVGRQVPAVEIAGPFAHWQAEEQLGRKIFVPMIDNAIDGLEVALGEIIYRRDEDSA